MTFLIRCFISPFIAGIIILLSTSCGIGAERAPIRFSRLNVDGGLSQSTVTQIIQDGKGYVWLATGDGLNRYDGYDVEIFKHDPKDDASISDNYIFSLIEGSDGSLWIGTAGNGLDRFDPTTATAVHFRHDPDDPNSLPSDHDVQALAFDVDGSLWVGTAQGLARLRSNDDQFERVPLGGVASPDAHPVGITCIHQGASGALYVGTTEGEVYVREEADDAFATLPLASASFPTGLYSPVNAMQEGDDRTLWFATEREGLFRLRRSENAVEKVSYVDGRSEQEDEVTAIALGADGNLWLGTRKSGLIDFDPLAEESTVHDNSPTDFRSLSGNAVRSLMLDTAGIIWVGTEDRGANRGGVAPTFIHYYRDSSRQETLPDNTVWAFAQMSDGGIWTGTGKGLGLFDPRRHRFVPFTPPAANGFDPSSMDVRALTVIGEDLWMGTWGEGLIRWNPSTGSSSRWTTIDGDETSLSNDKIRLVVPDRKGKLWIGTRRGLNLFDPETGMFERFRASTNDGVSLPNENIRAIRVSRDGTLWVGTSGGISRMNADRGFTTWSTKSAPTNALLDDDIRYIHEDDHGDLWLATGYGLTLFDPEKGPVRTFDTGDGFRNSTLYGIQPDRAGNLWISTNDGLSVFDPRTRKARTFTVTDGLQGNEFNYGAHLVADDGVMLFGGINGFNSFHPDRVLAAPSDSDAPRLVVSRLSVISDDGRETTRPADGTPIRLTHRDSTVVIRFVALHYDNPTASSYSTWLDGLEPLWSPWRRDTREIRFSELPAGSHILRVRAMSGRGVAAREEIAIPLEVRPAPWLTPLAFAVYVVAMLAVGATAHWYRARWRLAAMRRDAERLQFEVDRKTRELRELLAYRSQLYRIFSHELRTPLSIVLSALEEARKGGATISSQIIDACSSNAMRLNRLIDQLLLLAKTDKAPEANAKPTREEIVNVAMVAGPLLHDFQVTARQRGISLSNDMAIDCHIAVPAETMGWILNNLISNAIKYSREGGAVEVAVSRAGDAVQIVVSDNGIGIAPEHQELIFKDFYRVPRDAVRHEAGSGLGLALVAHLVAQYGGRITVQSAKNEGARFTVTLPFCDPDGDETSPAASVSAMDPLEPREMHEPASSSAASMGVAGKRGGSGSRPRPILVLVEDDPELAKWLPQFLEPEFECYVATDFDSGIATIRDLVPDIVLCDVMLNSSPDDRSGFEIARLIKNDMIISHIPVVLLTALGMDEDIQTGLAHEVDDYITKPFKNDLLRQKIRNLVANRQRVRERVERLLGKISATNETDARSASYDLLEGPLLDTESRKFLASLKEIIEAPIKDERLNVAEIARQLTVGNGRVIGERQLQRKIKNITGVSFGEYRRMVEMRKAKELLALGMSATEVAHAIGFNNYGHFSNTFQKFFGVNPSSYKISRNGVAGDSNS